MFETLSDRLSGALEKLTGKGALNEGDVAVALREVRVALLEADVSLTVARDFIKRVQEKATGSAVLKSVTPGQQVVKIVHDELLHVLAGDDPEPGKLRIDTPPATILMVGLQGSGKTTTTGKLAKRPRSASIPCLSSRASRRSTSPNGPNSRRPWAAMTWSCWTPPAGCMSTTS
jgi:signal recognition particle subunit SRP54